MAENRKILLSEVFNGINNQKVKIKFNMNPSNPEVKAWDLLLSDDSAWTEMNAYKSKKNINNNMGTSDYLLAFAQYYPYGPEYFIFGGYYKVHKIEPEIFEAVGYKLELQNEYSEYIKRLIIKLEKPIGRNVYLRVYSTFLESNYSPEIYELAARTKMGPFPGYNKVRISHKNLQQIVQKEEPSWKNALSAVKAIYVLTDKNNGKLYIGSASGNTDGLWQRWSSYAHLQDSTGGNQELKELRLKLGNQYIIDNFQYSILEIFDIKTKAKDILYRESYWKKVLDTKSPHGYNKN